MTFSIETSLSYSSWLPLSPNFQHILVFRLNQIKTHNIRQPIMKKISTTFSASFARRHVSNCSRTRTTPYRAVEYAEKKDDRTKKKNDSYEFEKLPPCSG